jgi:hypothetical protein
MMSCDHLSNGEEIARLLILIPHHLILYLLTNLALQPVYSYTVNIFSMNFIQKSRYPHRRNIQFKIVRLHSKRTEIIRKQRIICGDTAIFEWYSSKKYLLCRACRRSYFHCSLSWARFVQSEAPRALLSLITPSPHLDFGLSCSHLILAPTFNLKFSCTKNCIQFFAVQEKLGPESGLHAIFWF